MAWDTIKPQINELESFRPTISEQPRILDDFCVPAASCNRRIGRPLSAVFAMTDITADELKEYLKDFNKFDKVLVKNPEDRVLNRGVTGR